MKSESLQVLSSSKLTIGHASSITSFLSSLSRSLSFSLSALRNTLSSWFASVLARQVLAKYLDLGVPSIGFSCDCSLPVRMQSRTVRHICYALPQGTRCRYRPYLRHCNAAGPLAPGWRARQGQTVRLRRVKTQAQLIHSDFSWTISICMCYRIVIEME